MSSEVATAKRMRLRFAGVYRVCGTELPVRALAVWERSSRTVRCVECPVAPAEVEAHEAVAVDPGTAGASARREYERRKAKDEQGFATAILASVD
ncbi:hypothetical protein [Aeromicrobium phoceense]|uniref:hypothetical protein n=1 Tax=Aeromicrobium phoceense TaxID=2754045 RepID=UPI0019D58843|nr:hypothetical protein [Aeromicrobium phoceense]